MVRGYFVSESSEITTWLDTENEVLPLLPVFRNEVSQECIQSLENTFCDYLEYKDYKYCLDHFPKWSK